MLTLLLERGGAVLEFGALCERERNVAVRKTVPEPLYQRETLRNDSNSTDEKNFAHATLRRIKAALDLLPENRTPTRKDWEHLSTAWRNELNDHITQLEHLRDRLSGCIGCGCLSLQGCKLINPNDILGRQGNGPRNL